MFIKETMINPTFIGDVDVIEGTYEMDEPDEPEPDLTEPDHDPDGIFSTHDTSTIPDLKPAVLRVYFLRGKIDDLYRHLGISDADSSLAQLENFRVTRRCRNRVFQER